ncbi:MAG: HEAT repeat domain-containing protein [Planctomycetes bacterium]|nr:HEAT repeat domain-containing protein [Planctomycetota bacterium]
MRRGLPPPVIALLALAGVVGGCRASAPTREGVAVAPGAWTRSDPRLTALADGDFADRARVAESLVAEGPRALPVLGPAADAADGERSRAALRLDATLRAVVAALPGGDLRAAIADPSPAVRAAAVAEAGRRGDTAAVPAVAARLDDDAARVRAQAVVAVRALTGQLTDVDPWAPREVTRAAAARVNLARGGPVGAGRPSGS